MYKNKTIKYPFRLYFMINTWTAFETLSELKADLNKYMNQISHGKQYINHKWVTLDLSDVMRG